MTYIDLNSDLSGNDRRKLAMCLQALENLSYIADGLRVRHHQGLAASSIGHVTDFDISPAPAPAVEAVTGRDRAFPWPGDRADHPYKRMGHLGDHRFGPLLIHLLHTPALEWSDTTQLA